MGHPVPRLARGREHDRRVRGRCRSGAATTGVPPGSRPAAAVGPDHGVAAVVRAVRQLADRGAGHRAGPGRVDPRTRRCRKGGHRRLDPGNRRPDGADHGAVGGRVVRPGARHEGPASPVFDHRHDRYLCRLGIPRAVRPGQQRLSLLTRHPEFAVLVELGVRSLRRPHSRCRARRRSGLRQRLDEHHEHTRHLHRQRDCRRALCSRPARRFDRRARRRQPRLPGADPERRARTAGDRRRRPPVRTRAVPALVLAQPRRAPQFLSGADHPALRQSRSRVVGHDLSLILSP